METFQRPARAPAQRLDPVAETPNLAEGLEARVKDPLWFIARQWQVGELTGESGGELVSVELEIERHPLLKIHKQEHSKEIERLVPLESQIEAETENA